MFKCFIIVMFAYIALMAVASGIGVRLFLTWKNFVILLIGGTIGAGIATPMMTISHTAGYVAFIVTITLAYISIYAKFWSWLWHKIPKSVRIVIINVLRIIGIILCILIIVLIFRKILGP